MKDNKEIARDAIRGGAKVGSTGVATSILSGFALVKLPVTFLGITVAESLEVAFPVVILFAIGGFLIGSAIYGIVSYRKQEEIERMFNEMTRDD